MTTESNKIGSTSSAPGCRICYEDSSVEELIEPCECSGTLGLIHTSCLERWLSTWNTDRCEICKYCFAVERRNKPFPQSFCQWWRARGLSYGPQGVTGDAICLMVLTPLCLATTYLCGIGVTAYARLGFWEGTGLAILCCMLVATYLLWLFVTIRFHFKSWIQWCKRNQDVKLLVKCRLSKEQSKSMKNDADRDHRDSEATQRNDLLRRLIAWLNHTFHPNIEPVYDFQQQAIFV